MQRFGHAINLMFKSSLKNKISQQYLTLR